MNILQADCIFIGGGFGGVAAALAATDAGLSVIMTEEYKWIGGQVTSQALCALDEMSFPAGERTGFNTSYYQFRELIRDYYRQHYTLSELGQEALFLNPGNAIVSSMCAEPLAAKWAIGHMLAPAIEDGRLRILTSYRPVQVKKENQLILSVTVEHIQQADDRIELQGDFFIDATEMGDLYPLADIPYRTGAEGQNEFGETLAPERGDPDDVQSFTQCFIVEFCPGESHLIEKPQGYEDIRERKTFRYSGICENGKFMDSALEWDKPYQRPFWAYRRLIDKKNFNDPKKANDIAVINVNSNDYAEKHLLDKSHDEQRNIIAEATNLSRCYLYWLQTEAPRDDGGTGYPELKPRGDLTGTPDGLAQAPYIREGRRLEALTLIVEQDLLQRDGDPARGTEYTDSIGLGCYFIDVHTSTGDSKDYFARTRPHQIPLGALLTEHCQNFAAGGKCIGVSHVANGAYRLHPQEWAIGEAAGQLAAFCRQSGKTPFAARNNPANLRAYQRQLLQRGVQLYWYDDVTLDTPGREAIQLLATTGYWPGEPDHLHFNPDGQIAKSSMLSGDFSDGTRAYKKFIDEGIDVTDIQLTTAYDQGKRRSDVAHMLAQRLAKHDREN